MTRSPRSFAGFTLIELMIAVAIVGILALIAYPSYSRFVLRGNRAVAKAQLADLAAKQDVYRLRMRSYAGDFSALNGMSGTTFYVDRSGTINSTAVSGSSIYQIAMTPSADGSSFSLTATPYGTQTRDTDCASMLLNSVGVRTSSPNTTDCWNK